MGVLFRGCGSRVWGCECSGYICLFASMLMYLCARGGAVFVGRVSDLVGDNGWLVVGCVLFMVCLLVLLFAGVRYMWCDLL